MYSLSSLDWRHAHEQPPWRNGVAQELGMPSLALLCQAKDV